MRINHFGDNFAATLVENNSGDGRRGPPVQPCSTCSALGAAFPRRSASEARSQAREQRCFAGWVHVDLAQLIAVLSLKINSVAVALTAHFRCWSLVVAIARPTWVPWAWVVRKAFTPRHSSAAAGRSTAWRGAGARLYFNVASTDLLAD